MNKLHYMLLAGIAGLFLTACGDDNDDLGGGENIPVEVTTPVVSSVTSSTATVSATFKGSGINRRGFCYATHQQPTIDDGDVKGNYQTTQTLTIADLTSNTQYYVRTYAMKGSEVLYSDEVTFTTLVKSGQDELDDWQAPQYADDYRSVNDWGKRDQWNLGNVHDPTVMLADDGYYYMYQTDASYGNVSMGTGKGHFHGRRSKNLIDWEYMGAPSCMMETPSWVLEKCNEYRAEAGLAPITEPSYLYWAPCARKVKEGLYRMYYCVGVDNYIKSGKPNTEKNFDNSWTERAFIGVMETADPASNNWVDKGMVICSVTDKVNTAYARSKINGYGDVFFMYNAIDPTFIITPEGEHWLAYGSWHSGIAIVQLDPETGKTLKPLGKPWKDTNTATPSANGYGTRIYCRTSGSRWQASEGPEIVYHDGYYYLFLAYDELDVNYNTRVVRSANVNGPYVNINGATVANGGDALPLLTHPYKFDLDKGWVGISHCAVFNDGKGNWFYASQQRFPKSSTDEYANAVMLGGVRRIVWINDWPVVLPERYAAVPQVEIAREDIIGTWDHIDLSYSKGNQKGSAPMTFGADGKITEGAWKNGTWSFDPETNTLTANGVKLKVARECDWEAQPRRHTLVYGGYNGSKTYWAKKR